MNSAVAGPEGVSAVEDSSLTSQLTDLLGDVDWSQDDASAVTPPDQDVGDAAGTPPAERPTDPSVAPASPEGTTDAVRTGPPPADAALAAPDVVPASPAVDPLAGASPFAYTVNNESRSVDGIQVLGDRGAIMTPDAVQKMRQVYSTHDNLMTRSRDQYALHQQYERLSEWTGKAADGTDITRTGLDGIIEMRAQNAQLLAENQVLNSLLEDPQRMLSLIMRDPADESKVVLDMERVQSLALRAELLRKNADESVRSRLAQLRTTPATSPSSAPPKIDFAAVAPSVLTEAAGAQHALLTAEDRAILSEQLPRYVRAATPQDVQANPLLHVGQPLVDASFTKLVTHHIGLRSASAKTAATVAKASEDNARALAQAQITRPATPLAAPVTPIAAAPKMSRSEELAAWQEKHMGG